MSELEGQSRLSGPFWQYGSVPPWQFVVRKEESFRPHHETRHSIFEAEIPNLISDYILLSDFER